MEKKSITGTVAGYEKTSPGVVNSPWLELAAAIVKCAADDYVRLLQKLWRKAQSIQVKRKLIIEKAELERSTDLPVQDPRNRKREGRHFKCQQKENQTASDGRRINQRRTKK